MVVVGETLAVPDPVPGKLGISGLVQDARLLDHVSVEDAPELIDAGLADNDAVAEGLLNMIIGPGVNAHAAEITPKKSAAIRTNKRDISCCPAMGA